MKTKLLIKDTTKEQRRKIVNDGIALVVLDDPMPSKDVIELYEYIEGNIELCQIHKIVLEKYLKKYRPSKRQLDYDFKG